MTRYYESELSGDCGDGECYVVTTDEPGVSERVAVKLGMCIFRDMRGNPDYEFTADGTPGRPEAKTITTEANRK